MQQPRTAWQVFTRFLRVGVLAWGGPVAQIGMLRDELVERERWVESERFQRMLGLYQSLPGPEAFELCVYLGMVARGRIGGLLAGLGFMLPGTIFVLAAAWWYERYGVGSEAMALLAGVQVAALALVLRALQRMAAASLARPRHWLIAAAVVVAMVVGGGILGAHDDPGGILHARAPVTEAPAAGEATVREVIGPGLTAGALSFGGAYTSIGFVHEAAVRTNGWLTDAQFLDSLALAGALPAPLVVFATFVGYLAGGLGPALAITGAIFLPALVLTLAGHELLERVVAAPRIHALLDAITAAVIGFIAATSITLAQASLQAWPHLLLLVACVAVLARWRSPVSIVAVVVASALVGPLLQA